MGHSESINHRACAGGGDPGHPHSGFEIGRDSRGLQRKLGGWAGAQLCPVHQLGMKWGALIPSGGDGAAEGTWCGVGGASLWFGAHVTLVAGGHQLGGPPLQAQPFLAPPPPLDPSWLGLLPLLST